VARASIYGSSERRGDDGAALRRGEIAEEVDEGLEATSSAAVLGTSFRRFFLLWRVRVSVRVST
jgi:hypothetical protein